MLRQYTWFNSFQKRWRLKSKDIGQITPFYPTMPNVCFGNELRWWASKMLLRVSISQCLLPSWWLCKLRASLSPLLSTIIYLGMKRHPKIMIRTYKVFKHHSACTMQGWKPLLVHILFPLCGLYLWISLELDTTRSHSWKTSRTPIAFPTMTSLRSLIMRRLILCHPV